MDGLEITTNWQGAKLSFMQLWNWLYEILLNKYIITWQFLHRGRLILQVKRGSLIIKLSILLVNYNSPVWLCHLLHICNNKNYDPFQLWCQPWNKKYLSISTITFRVLVEHILQSTNSLTSYIIHAIVISHYQPSQTLWNNHVPPDNSR